MGFVEQIEIRKWVEYLEALEEERKKIQVFQRELPLCLELVTHTIERCRRQLMVSDDMICCEVDVLEEFTTPKRSLTPEELEEEEEEESSHENQNTGDEEEEEREQHKDQQKSNWFQSVQLSIQQPNRSDEEDESKPEKPIGLDLKKTTGAFHPFHRDRKLLPTAETPPPLPLLVASGNSMTNTNNGGSGNDKSQGQQSHRKTRRCWSPELHRQFLRALNDLGGSHDQRVDEGRWSHQRRGQESSPEVPSAHTTAEPVRHRKWPLSTAAVYPGGWHMGSTTTTGLCDHRGFSAGNQ